MKVTQEVSGLSRRSLLRVAALSTVSLAVAGPVSAESAVAAPSGPSASVSGPLRSAGVLTFGGGEGNVLFVGDIPGGAVHAFALRPSSR